MLGSRKAHTTLAHSSSAGELNPLPPSPPGPSGLMPLPPPPPAILSSTGGGHHHSHSHHSHHSHHHSSSHSSSNQNQSQNHRQINSASIYGSVNRLNLVQQTTRGDVSGPHGQSAGGQGGNAAPAAASAAPTSVNIPKHLNELFGVSPSDIDKYSRVVFPVCFVCFNLMYWMIYLHISKILEDDFVALNSD